MRKTLFLILGMLLLVGMLNFVSAAWNQSYNNNLEAYFPFSNGSNVVINDVKWNVTTGTPVYNASYCIKDNCLHANNGAIALNASKFQYLNFSNRINNTINFWLLTTTTDSLYVLYGGSSFISVSGGRFYWEVGCGTAGVGTNLITGNMNMLTILTNDSGKFCFLNSVLDKSGNVAPQPTNPIVYFPYTSTQSNRSIDEMGYWNRSLSEYEVIQLYNTGSGMFYDYSKVTTVSTPTITTTLRTPPDGTKLLTIPTMYSFNASYTMTGGNLTNATLQVWYQNGSLFQSNYSTVNTLLNSTNLSLSNWVINSFKWNYNICGTNSSGLNATCSYAPANYSFTISALNETGITYNTSSYETSREFFLLNFSTNYTLNSASFVYNGTSYSSSILCSNPTYSNGNCSVNASIGLPLTQSGANFNFNNTFYWNLNFTGFSQSTLSYGQNTSIIFLTLCNTTWTVPYVNYTFHDEVSDLLLNASIPTSSFTYWLLGGSGSINKTYTYSSVPENNSYSFCFYPQSKSINVQDYIQYKNSNYPQRISSTLRSLTNTTLNKILYLLGSTDGIYVTFQVINANTEQSLSDVVIIVNRTIGSVETIGYGLTGSDGAVTFWLNPDFFHTFLFTKVGYNSYSTSIYPTQSQYTIGLSTGTSTAVTVDYTRGISYLITPQGGAKLASLKNDTWYNFTYYLQTSYWTLDSFGFHLFYGNGTEIGENSSTSNGGMVSLSGFTGNQPKIRMDTYYVINGTYYNATRTWYVEGGGTPFSILNFFNDLSSYLNAGLFGIDNFGKVLLSIFIIVLVIGGMSYRYGMNSEAAIFGALFGLVYFFDIGVELLPQETFGIPHFVTIVAGLLMITFLFKEELR